MGNKGSAWYEGLASHFHRVGLPTRLFDSSKGTVVRNDRVVTVRTHHGTSPASRGEKRRRYRLRKRQRDGIMPRA
jgi:hypothetical protein